MHLCCLSLCVQALASLRQKIKKYIKEADFETSVEEFRKVGTYVRDTWREHSCGRGDRGLSALAACCSVCTMHHTLYIYVHNLNYNKIYRFMLKSPR